MFDGRSPSSFNDTSGEVTAKPRPSVPGEPGSHRPCIDSPCPVYATLPLTAPWHASGLPWPTPWTRTATSASSPAAGRSGMATTAATRPKAARRRHHRVPRAKRRPPVVRNHHGAASEDATDVGPGEIIAREQQRLARHACERKGDGVSEIQTRGVPSLAEAPVRSASTATTSAFWINASSSRPPGSPFRASMTMAVSSSVAAETRRVGSSSRRPHERPRPPALEQQCQQCRGIEHHQRGMPRSS